MIRIEATPWKYGITMAFIGALFHFAEHSNIVTAVLQAAVCGVS